MFILTVKQKFCAAHKLVGYDGDCSNIHGHTWMVEVNIKCAGLNSIGIALDFKEIKQRLKQILPDHKYLNEHYKFNPTAEQLAEYFYNKLTQPYNSNKGDLMWSLESVVVWESENACIRYTKEG